MRKFLRIFEGMHLQRLTLFNFKNYLQADLDLDASCNAFTGDNGEGKTNLLDAIHYLALCKSYFHPIDSQNILHEQDAGMVQGVFIKNDVEDTFSCALRRNQKKIFKRNSKEYDRLTDHIGSIPVVMIAPTDTCLITDGSEERRRFLDGIISQFDRRYLDDLVNYNRLISQRNALLKQASSSGRMDRETLEVLDEQLVPYGVRIHEVRRRFIGDFVPVFGGFYSFISAGKEPVTVEYSSHLSSGDFRETLARSFDRDRSATYTTVGIHKDDLDFMIDGRPVRRFASQGQQKSFVISLKLAQFDLMRDRAGAKPILLLDDIFDKLDDKRVARLMELVSEDHFGQLFITDTHPRRITDIFHQIGRRIRCFSVSNGSVLPAEPFMQGQEVHHA
jgi:DNA replication and repair protein RecF